MGGLKAVPRAAVAPRAAVKGVDLNLGAFDLSDTVPLAQEDSTRSWAGDFKSSDPSLVVGSAFWASVDGDAESALTEEDKQLLRSIFNPSFSDRRDEADAFVPPDTSMSYIRKLRDLVKNEEMVRQERKDHFFSTRFSINDAGSVFPRSWTASIEIV